MTWVRTTPARVWIICLFFALLQPLTHALVLYCAPAGVVPTGLHKPDSTIFIHTMRMFETGFYSPYATCLSPFGDHSARFFTTPFYILYAIAGALGSLLRVDDFTMLGIANGFGAACYLLAIYHFMLTVLPKHADRAFMLFAFSGGLGGIFYVACAAFGITDTATFSDWFYRFAIYDLVEGANLAPYLLMPRLYYTVPLALGFAGLTTCIVSWRIQCPIHLVYAQALLFVCALLNARLGPPLGGIALLFLAQRSEMSLRRVLHVAAPLVGGVVSASLVMKLNPGFVDNAYAVVRQQMWLSSFGSAGFPLLLLAGPLLVRDAGRLTRGFRALAFGGLGFLALFAALFLLYQIYYGTLFIGADHAASVRVSDLSLAGIALGLAWQARRVRSHENPEHGWIIVWVVVFTAVAVSAFWQGWFLRYSPQRLMVFLGVPLSLLAAEAIARLKLSRPLIATAGTALVFSCGLSSLAVSTLVFQGPLGMRPGLASDIGMHAAYLRGADAECLERLGPGVIAAPWPYNDILSVREGVKVIGGYGSVGLSDQGSGKLDADVVRFFLLTTPLAYRSEFIRTWCVAHVFLPSDAKAREALASEFDAVPEFRRIAEVDGAILYAVR